MREIFVWDLFVRLFHWSIVILFFSTMFVLDDDGKAHQYAGYIVLGLVCARFLWGFIGTSAARFSSFPPNVPAAVRHLRHILSGTPEKPCLSHNPLGALMVYNLLLALGFICVTGVMMTTDRFWGGEWVEELHEVAAYYTLFSVVLHVLGVIIESRRSSTNLVHAMITGRKKFYDHT